MQDLKRLEEEKVKLLEQREQSSRVESQTDKNK